MGKCRMPLIADGGTGKPINSKGFQCLTKMTELKPLTLCNKNNRNNIEIGAIKSIANDTKYSIVSYEYDEEHFVNITSYSGTSKDVYLGRTDGNMATWKIGTAQRYSFSGMYENFMAPVKYDDETMVIVSYSSKTLRIGMVKVDWENLTILSHTYFTITLPSTAGSFYYSSYAPKILKGILLLPTSTGIASINIASKSLINFLVTSAVPMVYKAKYHKETDSYYTWCDELTATMTRRFVQFKVSTSGYSQVNLQTITRDSSLTATSPSRLSLSCDTAGFTDNYAMFIIASDAGYRFYRGKIIQNGQILTVDVEASPFATNDYTNSSQGFVALADDFVIMTIYSSYSGSPANYDQWLYIDVANKKISSVQGLYEYWFMELRPVNKWFFIYYYGTSQMVSGNHYSTFLRGKYYELTAASSGINGYNAITYSGRDERGLVEVAVLE